MLPITYPFELVRVRMALHSGSGKRPSLLPVLQGIYKEHSLSHAIPLGGLASFYRGFLVTLIGTLPYRGGIFLVWETLNSRSRKLFSPSFRAAHQHKIHLVVGAIAGTSAQIATYPLEVVRRMQQASGSLKLRGRMGFGDTVRKVWHTSGWRGFYAGLGIGLVKQVPMHR